MSCEKCGAAVAMKEQSGGIKSGSFMERYECANGHEGYVSGEASDPPEEWNQSGPVFQTFEVSV